MEKAEIICISSDDDEDVNQSTPANGQIQFGSKLGDICVSNIKEEVSLSDNEKLRKCGQKRKGSELTSDDNDASDSERNVKVLAREKANNIDDSNVGQEKEKNGREKKILLKPQLVVKERKSISPVVQDIFPMFISLCLQKDRSDEMKVIVNKLKRRYEQLDSAYANSEVFTDFLNEKRNDIMNSKNKLYIHIAEVMNEMRNSCKGKSSLLLNGKSSTPATNKLNANNGSNASSSMCSNTARTSNDTISDNQTEEQNRHARTQEKINLLLKTMGKCERYIKRLEEAEVNFDNENDSNYIKLEKFKCQMVKLYRKYCEYTGENSDAGRQYLRPKHFSTTGIVAVDHAITKFINSKISKRNKLRRTGAFIKALIFPDYNDILKCVTKCNESNNLGLSNKKQQQIAKKAFTELGEYLQRCRRNDYWDTFSLFLEGKGDDPASKDTALAEKLAQNKKEGENKLSNIFQEYVKKQEEMKNQIVDSKTSSEIEEGEGSSKNENDEDSAENEDEDDNMSEIEAGLSTEKRKVSSDENERSTPGDELPKSTASTSDRASSESKTKGTTDSDVIEIKETQVIGTADKLEKNDDNNLETRKIDVASTSNGKSNLNSQLAERNDATSSLNVTQDWDTAPNDIKTTKPSNDVSLDRAKEDKPNIISEDRMGVKALREEEGEECKEKEDKEDEERQEEKPLLRLRSFAKPPTTWKDVHEKAEEHNAGENILEKRSDKDVIDLTKETPKENITGHRRANFALGYKMFPTEVMKTKFKTIVIPAGKSIINVKSAANNFVRLNTKNMDLRNVGKLECASLVQSQPVVTKSTKTVAIQLLPNLTAIDPRKGINNQPQAFRTKQTSTTMLSSQSNQLVWLPKTQGQGMLQHPKTNSSRSQAK